MAEETWSSLEDEKQADDREEDWGESAPVEPIREEPIVPTSPPIDGGTTLLRGRVTSFNADAQYGFLDGGEGIGRVFVNHEGLKSAGIDRLYEGQEVAFEMEKQTARVVRVDEPFTIVPVFFATDRRRVDDADQHSNFANEYGAKLQFGTADVAIPTTHSVGKLETPSIWRLEFVEDPKRHIVLKGIFHLPEDAFIAGLREASGQGSKGEALVFIHGFNVSFADAVRRTAQLAVDLKISGPAISYSWASHADTVLYPHDATNNERTVPHLAHVLTRIAYESGASSVHLIAHSMGNRALVHALSQIASDLSAGQPILFTEAILAAPDIDTTVFKNLASRFRSTAKRFTIYASRNDLALKISREFNGFSRVGDTDEGIVLVPGMDSIDASSVDTSLLGHSYYGNKRSVLDDIFELLNTGGTPDSRFNLLAVDMADGRFWKFRT